MQRPRPSGGLHRFFAPVCAVTAAAAFKEKEAKAKEEKEKENADDETEIDAPPSSSSSPLLLRPAATKPLVEAVRAAEDAPPRVTYSRRKKEAKRPAESDDDEKEKECPTALPLTTTTTATKDRPPPPPPPPPPQKKKKKALTQAHLDLGQRAFVCLTCSQCGMVYAPGDAGDERVHSTFHADALQGPRLLLGGRVSSGPLSSSSSSSPSSLVEVISLPPSLGSGGGGTRGGRADLLRGRVLHAPPGPALAGAGVGRALAVAEAALGAVPGWLLGLCSTRPAAARDGGTGEEEEEGGEGGSGGVGGGGEPASPSSPSSFQRRPTPRPLTAAAALRCGKHAFLFECSETRRAVGVAVVEALASGTRLRRVGGGGGGGGGGGEGGAGGAEATPPPPTTAGAAGAALGVRGVWVAPSHRRRGVATALLDAARARAVAYTVVGRRALVVFSQPTEAGGGEALARSYAGGGGKGGGGGGGFWSYL